MLPADLTFSAYSDHTAVLPATMAQGAFQASYGNTSMTNQLLSNVDTENVTGSNAWSVNAAGRWEVDDYRAESGMYNHNTYHQIWVRANRITSVPLRDLVMERVLDQSGSFVKSTSLNQAHSTCTRWPPPRRREDHRVRAHAHHHSRARYRRPALRDLLGFFNTFEAVKLNGTVISSVPAWLP